MKKLIFMFLFFLSEIALADPVLIGGKIAKPGEFPEVVYISSGRSRCSATIVGPNVILTAAHCIQDGGEIFPAEFVIQQQAFKAKCMHHPEYSTRYSFDFALCKTKQPIEGIKPATISKIAPEVGKKASLMGFGCINPRRPDGGADGGNDGKLRWGNALVTQIDNGVNGVGGGQYFYTSDETSLCFGDSGGPAMLPLSNPKAEAHYVIGVNSRGNIVDRSLLSSTFMDGFQNWAKAYAMSNDVEICGINKDCINGNPDPDPDPRPDPRDDECIEERYYVWLYGKRLDQWKNKLDICQAVEL